MPHVRVAGSTFGIGMWRCPFPEVQSDGIFLCEDCRNESMNALYLTMDCYEIDDMSNILDLQYKRPKERTILTASSFLYNMRFVRSASGIRSRFYLSLLDI